MTSDTLKSLSACCLEQKIVAKHEPVEVKSIHKYFILKNYKCYLYHLNRSRQVIDLDLINPFRNILEISKNAQKPKVMIKKLLARSYQDNAQNCVIKISYQSECLDRFL